MQQPSYDGEVCAGEDVYTFVIEATTAPQACIAVTGVFRPVYGTSWWRRLPRRAACTFRSQKAARSASEIVADLPGLEIERSERLERPVQTADGDRVALDLLVRASLPVTNPGS